MHLLITLALVATLHAAPPKLIAHRGASGAAPENTLAAFKLAWKEGADGIEGDFRLSKDGRIVCIHDEDTHRTTGKTLAVADTNWDQLKALDAGSWKAKQFSGERLPLLEEVLAILPSEKYFFLEIKSGPEIVQPLIHLLSKADRDYVFLISFDPHVVMACRKQLPDFQTHLISSLNGIQKSANETRYLEILDATGATGLQFRHDARVTRDFFAQVQKGGRLTACWTVDSPGTAKRVAAMGVDFITTNRPAIIRKQTSWSR